MSTFDSLTPPYSTIVADPPWGYEGRTPPWRSTSEATYPLMTLDEIMALPVADLAAADAHLYLWAVLPMMTEAYRVVDAWGFTADTALTWCKPGVGLGAGYRGNTEHLIVARRGFSYINPTCDACGGRARGAKKCACIEPRWRHKGRRVEDAPRRSFMSTACGTWYAAPRGGHSTKPGLFMDLIERMSPAPRVELFARTLRPGWHAWGDEAPEAIAALYPSPGDRDDSEEQK